MAGVNGKEIWTRMSREPGGPLQRARQSAGARREPALAQSAFVPRSDSAPIVEARGITKRFGPVIANNQIDLTLREGEIHAILGENGAGKTTLLNILSGMYQPDAGTILIRGQETKLHSPADALRQGIGTVYQHFTLVPNLSIIENVVLGAESDFLLNLEAAERRLHDLLGDFELTVSPHTEIRHLSLGQRQRVEIIKVLYRGSRVLLLDEPTSVLTPVEVEGLFGILRRLRESGVAVALITHKLGEALEISDRITILRQGRKVGEIGSELRGASQPEQVRQRIVELMFGGIPAEAPHGARPAAHDHAPLLVLQQVSAHGDRGEVAVRGLSLDLRAGEVFGIAGVDGNGQKELGEVIAGQRPVSQGRILLDGQDITNRGVATATRLGIGYVTDDRLGEGCVPGLSVAENAVLKMVTRPPFRRGFWLNRSAVEQEARRLISQFDIKTPSTRTGITTLSGGNIQKLLLARELAMNPRVLVCNKPTHGLDLKTARFVLQTLRAQASAGKAILLIASELDETDGGERPDRGDVQRPDRWRVR
ncbi:MAG: ABC transporter [Thermomicrobiales bacterium]|nr:MAG: ABC transporter [Thermomicrobiales bacterium]